MSKVLVQQLLLAKFTEGAWNFPGFRVQRDLTLDFREIELAKLNFDGAHFNGRLRVIGGDRRVQTLRLNYATIEGLFDFRRAGARLIIEREGLKPKGGIIPSAELSSRKERSAGRLARAFA